MHNMMGGDYDCRICGQRHSSAILHDKMEISRLQKIQMAIENLEVAIESIMMVRKVRENLRSKLEDLKKALMVNGEKIYVSNKALEVYEYHNGAIILPQLAHSSYGEIIEIINSVPMIIEQQDRIEELIKKVGENVFSN